VLAEHTLDAPARHLEGLLPAVDEMLRSLGLTRDAVGGVAVSRGPGGFTGLRIGIATAAAWARSARIPLIGVDTLEGLALAAAGGAGWILAALDAHRGEVAAALYRVPSDGPPDRAMGPIVAPPAFAAREAAAVLDPASVHLGSAAGVLVVGDGLVKHREALLAGLGGRAASAREDLHPRAGAVGVLGRARLVAGAREDPETLVPVYGRRPAISTWPSGAAEKRSRTE
jgi:tRNA threonylcarbamoyladenosine biosynthesis protein TsaB